MTSCLNCGQEIPAGREFCDYCNENLDTMVDAGEMAKTTYEVGTTDSMNPFYSSTHLSGGIVNPSKDSVEMIAQEEDGYGPFFKVLGVIAFIMIVIAYIYLR